MERLRYWNFLGEIFELEQAGGKCLELENQAARLLSRLQGGGRRPGEDPGLEEDLRGFLGGLSRELRAVTPRLPARPLGWSPAGPAALPQMGPSTAESRYGQSPSSGNRLQSPSTLKEVAG